MSSTTGRVHDDLRVAPGERVDVVAGELASALALAGMGVQRAAAGLLVGYGHRFAVGFEDAHGRPLGLAEGFAHHAAGKERRRRAGPVDALERRAFACRRERRGPGDASPEGTREAEQPYATREVREPREPGQASAVRDGIERRTTE